MIECKRLAALGSVDEHKFMTTFGLALVPETVVPFDPPRVHFKISEHAIWLICLHGSCPLIARK